MVYIYTYIGLSLQRLTDIPTDSILIIATNWIVGEIRTIGICNNKITIGTLTKTKSFRNNKTKHKGFKKHMQWQECTTIGQVWRMIPKNQSRVNKRKIRLENPVILGKVLMLTFLNKVKKGVKTVP